VQLFSSTLIIFLNEINVKIEMLVWSYVFLLSKDAVAIFTKLS